MKNKYFTYQLVITSVLLLLIYSCKKKDDNNDNTPTGPVPVLSTNNVSTISSTTAICGGNISSDGGSTVTARGVCWSTGQTPSITNSKTTDGTGAGSFSSNISGLTANTTYYVRAYATNSNGTGYGSAMSFTTQQTLTDIDGNNYGFVVIGTQTWMASNLKVTKYRNGDLIGTTTPASLDVSSESTPKYQWAYDGIESNVSTYGRLYTWHAATDSRGICPTGWHLPSDAEWTTLMTFLDPSTNPNANGIHSSIAGGKLKETGTTHWASPNTGATNEFGFTALPGGGHYSDGTFFSIYLSAFWWTSTQATSSTAFNRAMGSDVQSAYRYQPDKKGGFSVRCVKD